MDQHISADNTISILLAMEFVMCFGIGRFRNKLLRPYFAERADNGLYKAFGYSFCQVQYEQIQGKSANASKPK